MKFQGVLFFPVTPFASGGSVDEERLAQHIEAGVAAGAGGVFVACGTGEFHALTPEEIERATRVAVATTAGRVPVLAAAGARPRSPATRPPGSNAPAPTASCCCRPIW